MASAGRRNVRKIPKTMTRLISVRTVKKAWGIETWVCNCELYGCKWLDLWPGYTSSPHFHAVKDETLSVVSGRCCLYILVTGKTLKLRPGDTIRLMPGIAHRLFNPYRKSCCILEVSTTHDDKDVYRYSESGRMCRHRVLGRNCNQCAP